MGEWIIPFNISGRARADVFLFPHAGGAATFFHPLAAELSDRLNCFAVQYPGRQERLDEPLVDDLDEVADRLFGIFRERTGSGPFVFFGHSMGAVIAFEVCRRLQEGGHRLPDALLVSARRAPQIQRAGAVHLLGDDDLITHVCALGGTPRVLFDDRDVRQMLLPAIRNDYRAIETYRWAPGAPVSCPVVGLVGDRDRDVSREDVGAWRSQTASRFEAHTFPGGHFYLSECWPEIAKIIELA